MRLTIPMMLLTPEELKVLRSHSTIELRYMLEDKVSLLNSLAEAPEFEDKELGLTFVDTEWPARLREVIKAIEDELSKRDARS